MYQNKKPAPPAEHPFPRRRCDNCPKFFWPVKEHQRFHDVKCRREFNRHGLAYIKLRELIRKQIEKDVAAQLDAMWPKLKAEIVSEISNLTAPV